MDYYVLVASIYYFQYNPFALNAFWEHKKCQNSKKITEFLAVFCVKESKKAKRKERKKENKKERKKIRKKEKRRERNKKE